MIQTTKQVVKTSAVWECLGTHEVDSNSGNLGSANSRDLWWRYCGKPNQIDNLPIYCKCVSKSSLLPWHFGPTKETSKCSWSLWTFSSTSIPWHQITVFPCIPIGGSMFTPPWVVISEWLVIQPIQPINSMKNSSLSVTPFLDWAHWRTNSRWQCASQVAWTSKSKVSWIQKFVPKPTDRHNFRIFMNHPCKLVRLDISVSNLHGVSQIAQWAPKLIMCHR